ncbi:hypothetical protein SAMN05660691_03482 [Rheinheimera pacifica]|uniref:Uncharacterized protein n=1 Tax=Rheinheimera pacifica TaxID=173990 RepID=A0A1H6NE38_9GAMM|nr:hypothetical protein [Rheinheimera pacifica]SEI08682.1 hypothetical protein SAMN05660691_03482 [Rheinheimera pacifica]
MSNYYRPLRLWCCASVFCCFTASAEQVPVIVNLMENSHVCNSETETARLAENEQLQEMARALVEFKATKFCFILPSAAAVQVLEQHATYIKFDYKSQVLYTFAKYVQVQTQALAQEQTY